MLSLHCELTLSAEYTLNIYCISYDEDEMEIALNIYCISYDEDEMEIALYLFKGSLCTGLFIAKLCLARKS